MTYVKSQIGVCLGRLPMVRRALFCSSCNVRR